MDFLRNFMDFLRDWMEFLRNFMDILKNFIDFLRRFPRSAAGQEIIKLICPKINLVIFGDWLRLTKASRRWFYNKFIITQLVIFSAHVWSIAEWEIQRCFSIWTSLRIPWTSIGNSMDSLSFLERIPKECQWFFKDSLAFSCISFREFKDVYKKFPWFP